MGRGAGDGAEVVGWGLDWRAPGCGSCREGYQPKLNHTVPRCTAAGKCKRRLPYVIARTKSNTQFTPPPSPASRLPPRSPLVLGKRAGAHGDEWCVASEDCAFGPIGFERVRDVQPGEMVIITEEGKLMSRQCAQVRAGLYGFKGSILKGFARYKVLL